MTTMTRARRRGMWTLATVVLLLALALAACGGRGLRGGDAQAGSGTQQTTTGSSQGGATLTGSAAQVASADDDLQQIVTALDGVQADASVDLSGSDSEVQP